VNPVLFQDPYKCENLLTSQATNSLSKTDSNSGSYICNAGRKKLSRLNLHLAVEVRASNSSVILRSVRKPYNHTTHNQMSLTLSNPIFLPRAYSPALIYFGRERGWWITCNYPTFLKHMACRETERVQPALSLG
jgi:hypothetical protein